MSMKNRLAFVEHLLENPHIYEAFKRFTRQALNAGMQHLGAHMIIQRIRWYTEIESRGEAYKINNNHFPYYARLFMEDYPKYSPGKWEKRHGFFRIKVMEEEQNGKCPEIRTLIKGCQAPSEWLFDI